MIKTVDFSEQINNDQKKYSRYVCDSRAIPNAIDGLKPVQRRILWTMWNSSARENFTKTVKVAGMVMAYHPHGNASIEDALSQMVQNFTFANNYPLISGEGTFGDILDPKAIASPRYTEVKIADFAKDVGLFESIPDLEYLTNYDETAKEPIFFIPKIPLIFLNPILGIATGFKTNLLGHRLSDVIDAVTEHLTGSFNEGNSLQPWYQGLQKNSYYYLVNENQQRIFKTQFAFTINKNSVFLTQAPQNWNREKVMVYLDTLTKEQPIIKDYLDHSKDSFQIEIIFKRGSKITPHKLKQIFAKANQEIIEQNIITYEGKLANYSDEAIIKDFCFCRKRHLITRFKRLASLEKEKIQKLSELMRFIKEEWHKKSTNIKSKSVFEQELKKANFQHYAWLVAIPIYRLTLNEVKKCQEAIREAKNQYQAFRKIIKNDDKLVDFMVQEIQALKKWDKKH